MVRDQYPAMRAIAQSQSGSARMEAEARVRHGLEAFASEHTLLIDGLISLIRRFSTNKEFKASKRAPEPESTLTKKPVDCLDEYPPYVNKILYEVLRNHASCTCVSPDTVESAAKRHLARKVLPNGT